MLTIEETWGVGEQKEFAIPGRYFRLLTTSAGVTVTFLNGGVETAERAQGVEAGYYAIPREGFSAFRIESAVGQTIKLAVSRGEGGYDRSQGNVNATPVLASALANVAPASVGTAAASVLAANASRRKVIFRAPLTNTANIALGASGVVLADAAILLEPGDTWIDETDAPAQWFAIAGAAGQALNILEAA